MPLTVLGLTLARSVTRLLLVKLWSRRNEYRLVPSKTGKFPEGAILALELVSAGAKKEPALQGTFESEFIGLEFAVKDSSRFENGWAYFSFSNGTGSSYHDKAQPFPASAGCVSCHKQNAATDNVFTQFYPVLRAVKPK